MVVMYAGGAMETAIVHFSVRTLARSREDYVGEWLPEPLLTSPDVAEDA